MLLINARITKKTFTRWKLLRNFAKKIFEKFDLCIVSNKESANYLAILGAKNIKNLGNLKFSNIKNNLNNKPDEFLLNKIKNRKIWCAASTHPNEEIICGKSHLKIKKTKNPHIYAGWKGRKGIKHFLSRKEIWKREEKFVYLRRK